MLGIAGFLEDAAIEGQPRKLAVEVSTVGRSRLSRCNGGLRRDGHVRGAVHQLITKRDNSRFLIHTISPN